MARQRLVVRRVGGADAVIGSTVPDLTDSPLLGPKGNREGLLYLTEAGEPLDLEAVLDAVIPARPLGPAGKRNESFRCAGVG